MPLPNGFYANPNTTPAPGFGVSGGAAYTRYGLPAAPGFAQPQFQGTDNSMNPVTNAPYDTGAGSGATPQDTASSGWDSVGSSTPYNYPAGNDLSSTTNHGQLDSNNTGGSTAGGQNSTSSPYNWLTGVTANSTAPGGSITYNPFGREFATPDTAQGIAQQFGGTAVGTNTDPKQGIGTYSQPTQMINFANGNQLNAGLMADALSKYGSAPGSYGNYLVQRDINGPAWAADYKNDPWNNYTGGDAAAEKNKAAADQLFKLMPTAQPGSPEWSQIQQAIQSGHITSQEAAVRGFRGASYTPGNPQTDPYAMMAQQAGYTGANSGTYNPNSGGEYGMWSKQGGQQGGQQGTFGLGNTLLNAPAGGGQYQGSNGGQNPMSAMSLLSMLMPGLFGGGGGQGGGWQRPPQMSNSFHGYPFFSQFA